MTWDRFTSIGVLDVVAAALSLPLISLTIALVIAVGILATKRAGADQRPSSAPFEAPGRSVASRYEPEHRVLGVAAVAVIVLFATENVVRGYLLNLADVVSWWRFATPVFCAFLGIAIALVFIASRGTARSEIPVVLADRRTWVSFGPHWGIVGAGIVLLLLLATTLAAGMASSPDGEGRYVWLEIPVPNESTIDPIRLWFYGWAYGVPVLICLAALSIDTWAALRCNAARPYIRPETVGLERFERREIATGIVRIATAGMLLALGGAWRFIASSGSISQLVIEGENEGAPYEAAWRYAELATAGGWLAPALEITAFVLLLLVASRLRRRNHSTTVPSTEAVDHTTSAGAAL